ncbi:MAG: NUDIX hydrolase [Chloroflexi bacterium]|nr:NUDIX hydrolase [Chloroflexota bacterium]
MEATDEGEIVMTYRFCPMCAHPLAWRTVPDDSHPRLSCAACGFVFYFNSRPCAGALAVREGKVLLSRRAVEPARGTWDIPGGFLENGEHPRDGAIRELQEETGLTIVPTELLGIYLDRYGDMPESTLNVYYLAAVQDGTPQPASDAAELGWFGPDELPSELAFPHERQVLEDWKRRAGA